jgi:hypothetical protein
MPSVERVPVTVRGTPTSVPTSHDVHSTFELPLFVDRSSPAVARCGSSTQQRDDDGMTSLRTVVPRHCDAISTLTPGSNDKVLLAEHSINHNDDNFDDDKIETSHRDNDDHQPRLYENASEWQAISRSLDRLFFIVFLTATVSFSFILSMIFVLSPPTEVGIISIS